MKRNLIEHKANISILALSFFYLVAICRWHKWTQPIRYVLPAYHHVIVQGGRNPHITNTLDIDKNGVAAYELISRQWWRKIQGHHMFRHWEVSVRVQTIWVHDYIPAPFTKLSRHRFSLGDAVTSMKARDSKVLFCEQCRYQFNAPLFVDKHNCLKHEKRRVSVWGSLKNVEWSTSQLTSCSVFVFAVTMTISGAILMINQLI